VLRNLSRFLWIPLVIYLLTLIWLGRFSRPQVDDLGWFYVVQKLGVKDGLHWLWLTNGGRLFSHLLILGAAKTGWPITIPWLMPAITLICQWIASLSLLSAAKTFLPNNVIANHIFFYSLLLTIAPLAIVPQPSTAIYWYSGAALYQWAYITALFLISFFLRWIASKNPIWLFFTAVFLFCAGNTNELSSLFINISFIVLCYLLHKRKKIQGGAMIFLLIVAFLALVLNFTAPGVYERKALMSEGKNLLTTPAAWVFWMITAFWHILCLPLTWVLAAELSALKYNNALTKKWWIFFSILSVTVLLILHGTGGSLALRTLNALTVILFIVLMMGIISSCILPAGITAANRKWLYTLAIFATPLTYQMIQTAVSGPGFAKAYDAQWQAIQDPSQKVPVISTLEYTMDSLAKRTSNRKLLQTTASTMPSLLWFDQARNERTTLQYMLRLTGKEYVVWGQDSIFNDHYTFSFPLKKNIME
jgi:hypothetical protein